ncbi:MAG: FHA domain-containing protein [Anaerolineales bacterium]|nr:FHA domain-containing protein [Anaerolineales bacterium]
MSPVFQLNMKAGPNPGQIIALDKPSFTIGREAGNDIVISDADVSRKHATLTLQGDTYLLEDLGSTNGTFVNGERIAGPTILTVGDMVSFGDAVELIYEVLGFDSAATLLAAPPPPPAIEEVPPPVIEEVPPPVEIPAPPVVEEVVAEVEEIVEAPAELKSLPKEPEFPKAEPLPEPLPAEMPPEKPKSKTGVIVAVGCVVLLCLCVIVVGVVYAVGNSQGWF